MAVGKDKGVSRGKWSIVKLNVRQWQKGNQAKPFRLPLNSILPEFQLSVVVIKNKDNSN